MCPDLIWKLSIDNEIFCDTTMAKNNIGQKVKKCINVKLTTSIHFNNVK